LSTWTLVLLAVAFVFGLAFHKFQQRSMCCSVTFLRLLDFLSTRTRTRIRTRARIRTPARAQATTVSARRVWESLPMCCSGEPAPDWCSVQRHTSTSAYLFGGLRQTGTATHLLALLCSVCLSICLPVCLPVCLSVLSLLPFLQHTLIFHMNEVNHVHIEQLSQRWSGPHLERCRNLFTTQYAHGQAQSGKCTEDAPF
jgi:hypothetical protein